MRGFKAIAALNVQVKKGTRTALGVRFLSDGKFFKVGNSTPYEAAHEFVVGKPVSHAADLRQAKPGSSINIPYETTVDESMRDLWFSAFHSNDRINTSKPFARSLGFQDAVLPYTMMLFLTGAMTHADAAKVQVGYKNAIYHWPAFPGDTFTRTFKIKARRTTSDGKHSLFTFACTLRNQRRKVIFTCDKTMLFPFPVEERDLELSDDELLEDTELNRGKDDVKQHIISKADHLSPLSSQSLTHLNTGELLLHSMCRPLSATQSMQLSSLARLTHPRHFDHHVYNQDEIYIPGGLVVGLTLSAASRDLHEVLHEEITECSYINNLHPGDTVSAFTYVQSHEENIAGDLELINLRTIGVKNLHVQEDLAGVKIPVSLFTGAVNRPRDYEALIKEHCPILSNRIVACIERKGSATDSPSRAVSSVDRKKQVREHRPNE